MSRVVVLRWLSFSVSGMVRYILLDRCAMYLQVWPGISAWYPPVGICFALFLYLDYGAFLPMLAASYFSAALNYHEAPFGAEFLLISPIVPTIYYAAAWLFRKRLAHVCHENGVARR
jgi:hypothetical protein